MWRRVDLPGESTKCLDGSSAAFFFRPPVDQPPLANQTFVFFLEGGGWCNSPIDCVSRTQSTFGSSARFPPDRTRNPGNGAGYFADNSLLGREFRSSTLIHVKYCDGASFSGEASVELHAANAQVALGPRRTIAKSQRFSIHFSGRGILRAIVNVMLADSTFGLRRAKHVLLSGCSAGGLAALLNADRLAQQILNGGVQLSRFKVVVFSGIFHAPDASPYAQQMRELFSFANMTGAATPACLGQSSIFAAEPWRCILNLAPLEALPSHIPAFVEQSAMDRWQTGCVLGARPSRYELVGCSAGEWSRCLQFMQPLTLARARGSKGRSGAPHEARPGQCTSSQLESLDAFSQEFMGRLQRSPAMRRPGYGSFLHGCHSHCPNRLNKFRIGQVSLEDAILRWWRAPMTAPAAEHSHSGCLTSWSGALGRSSGVAVGDAPRTPECKLACSPLYAWPDERRSVAARSRAVEHAIRGGPASETLLVR